MEPEANPTILVADDELVCRKRLQHLLQRSGYDTLLASDGQEALDLIHRESKIDVVLTDVSMPNLDGLSLVKKVREKRDMIELPVIVMTCNDGRSQVLQAFEAQANDYVRKPVDNEIVLARIKSQVAVRRIKMELVASQEQKELLHIELMKASHQAGMAEVATGVLHDVGNVMNSVNTSVMSILDMLEKSRVSQLEKVIGLVGNQQNPVAKLLQADKQGQQLVAYLQKLAEALFKSRDASVSEAHSLRQNINHVCEIISMQQSYSRMGGIIEEFCLNKLCNDAIQINSAGLTLQGVQLETEFGDFPLMQSEKHKILQILVNLISNAKGAVRATDRREKWIRIKTCHDGAKFIVEVKDNGIGIAPDDAAKLFQHGFTTKSDGHGFGLHSSINAAREIGGDITFESDGTGCGATFRLLLSSAANSSTDNAAARTTRTLPFTTTNVLPTSLPVQ